MQVVLFSGLFVSHITEMRLNHSFSRCELIMRQATIKMFALIVCRVIRGGLQYTRENKVGHAWRKELRRPTISQLPTTVKRAEKYERTVGLETQQDKPLSISLFLSFLPSLCLILALCLPQIMLHNHKEMPCTWETDLKQSGGKRAVKKGSQRDLHKQLGVLFLYICLKGQHGRELGSTVKPHCSHTQVQTDMHLTTLHMLT